MTRGRIELINTSQPVNIENIYVIGSGMSLDGFDNSIIKDNDLVISTNAGVCAVPKRSDYFVVSNWFSLRESISSKWADNTTIICYSKLSAFPTILTKEYIEPGPIRKETFSRVSSLLIQHKPIIMDYVFDVAIMQNPDLVSNYIEERRILPAGSGSGPASLILALYLNSKLDITGSIYYVGFDFVTIKYGGKEIRYPYIASNTMKWNSAKHCAPNKGIYRSVRPEHIQWAYKHQLSICLLIASLNESFYNKMKSLSIFDVSDISYEKLVDVRLATASMLVQKKRTTLSPEDLDAVYEMAYGKRNLGQWFKERASIILNVKDDPYFMPASSNMQLSMNMPVTTTSRVASKKSKSIKPNCIKVDNNAKKILVCRRWGGIGDQFLLNLVWPQVMRPNVEYSFITPKKYHSIHTNAGFKELIDFSLLGLSEREGVLNNTTTMNRLISTMKDKFPGYNEYIDVSHMCGITEHEIELEKYGRIHSDRVHIWSRCFGVNPGLNKVISYKITSEEDREASLILAGISNRFKKKGPIVGYSPYGSNAWTLADNYKEIGSALVNAGFNLLVLHNEPLGVDGAEQIPVLDYRMMAAIMSKLYMVYTINTSWHILALMFNIPSIVDFKWGAYTQYARYHPLGEYLPPDRMSRPYCLGCESKPAHLKWHPKECWSGEPHKSPINCQVRNIRKIVHTCKSVFRSREYALSSPIGIILNKYDEVLAIDKVRELYPTRGIIAICTSNDTRTYNMIRGYVASKNVAAVSMPTNTGEVDATLATYLRNNRFNIFYEAKYLDLEIGGMS